MKKYTAGFIGAGNMGGALLQCVSKKIGAENIILSCSTPESSANTAKKYGCDCSDITEVASKSEFLFLGIKPQIAENVLSAIKHIVSERSDCVVVSMLAGKSIEFISSVCGTDKVIRIMPNTPVAIGCGMTLVTRSATVSDDTLERFLDMISESGKTDVIPETLIDVGCALSGCGPAFVYMFIEALSEGAVKCGLPANKAFEYAAQTLYGASRLMQETGKHPAELKDAVCSPGGSTVAGVAALEKDGFRYAGIDAVMAAYKRTCELGNN